MNYAMHLNRLWTRRWIGLGLCAACCALALPAFAEGDDPCDKQGPNVPLGANTQLNPSDTAGPNDQPYTAPDGAAAAGTFADPGDSSAAGGPTDRNYDAADPYAGSPYDPAKVNEATSYKNAEDNTAADYNASDYKDAEVYEGSDYDKARSNKAEQYKGARDNKAQGYSDARNY